MLCAGPLWGAGGREVISFLIRRTGLDIYHLIVVLLYINLAQQLRFLLLMLLLLLLL